MTLSAWQSALGVAQGRIESTDVPGTYVLVLGHAQAGTTAVLAPGDFVQVAQTAPIGDVGQLQRAGVKVRAPSIAAPGAWWLFTMSLDGVALASIPIPSDGRTYNLADFGMRIEPAGAEVAFRLELEGVPGEYDVELPGVFIDNLLEEDVGTASPQVLNRWPEPGWIGVPADQVVRFDVVDVGTSTVDLTTLDVQVDGELAVVAGAFQPGWQGARSAITAIGAHGYRVEIEREQPFASERVVAVSVRAGIVGAPSAGWGVAPWGTSPYGSGTTGSAATQAGLSYAFTVEDLEPPAILRAEATGLSTIEVTMAEPVLMTAAAHGALAPASWTIELATGAAQTRTPAVPAVVLACATIGPDKVALFTDIPLTARATYIVRTTVADLSGNVATDPTNAASFVAFTPPQPAGRSFDVWSKLPRINRLLDVGVGDLRLWVGLLEDIFEQVLWEIDRWTTLLDPDEAPERFVELMLRDLGDPFSAILTLNETDKRRLAQVLVPIYRSKGTDPGIINAIRFFLGIDVTITHLAYQSINQLGVSTLGGSFVLGTSDPELHRTFIVNVPIVIDEETALRIVRIVSYMKRGETYFRVQGPALPNVVNHWILGVSQLGPQTILHP